MINVLLSELKQIAQSILDHEDSINIAELDLRLRALQKKITILEYQQQKNLTEAQSKVEPIEFDNSKQITQEPIPSELAPKKTSLHHLKACLLTLLVTPFL